MQTVAIVIHLMIVATLIATVLLQKSEGGGLGVGGGAGFMSSRGTANLLTRTTAVLVRLLPDEPVPVLVRKLRPQAEFDHRQRASLAVTAGRTGNADIPANRRRPSGFAEEGGRAAAEPAGAVGSASAAVAIKQGGHAGRQLLFCISNAHQYLDIALNFTSPTAQ